MAELVGDVNVALGFLLWARPRGPWVITGIAPDRKKIETDTFTELTKLGDWLAPRIGVLNLYWMVNSPRKALTSKASKEDVASLDFLHVDCDPTKDLKGKAHAADRAAILERLQSFKPAPSAIVDSGGGFQAFWRLKEPFPVRNLARAEELEAYNLQLEMLLKGDHCHNIDRIMRLPGTVNLPDEKKVKAGRVKALALVVYAIDTAYDIEHFTPAPRVQAKEPGTLNGNGDVKISGNLPPVLVDDLPDAVTPRIKMLIVQGNDPDDPTKYASRSEAVWAVLCGLIRAGCDVNTIASIMLDPDYAISAHVRSQKRPHQYIERQIQRAQEEVIEPWLKKLNDEHAVIMNMGGRCLVISEIVDATVTPPRTKISKQTFTDFQNSYMNQKVQTGKNNNGDPVFKPVGNWWLNHPLRRQYKTIAFAPNKVIGDVYNLWTGFACEAIPGTNHQLFLDHILQNICSNNEEWYTYVVNWMARGVQHPETQGEVAIVLRGARGTGKGTLATCYGSLWGRHFLHISSAKHLVGQFNAHLRDCVVIYADEAFFAGDKQHEGVLKTLITESALVIEGKGVDAEVSSNFIHLIMASNSDWVVPAGLGERRFFVLDVTEERMQDNVFFGKLREGMDNGGRESLLYFLMNLDISGFDVRVIPKTAALQTQKIHSLSLEEAWWLERLEDGTTTSMSEAWEPMVEKSTMFNDYIRYAEQQRNNRRQSPKGLGTTLKRMMRGSLRTVQRMRTVEVMSETTGQYEMVDKRMNCYIMPTLKEAREAWVKSFGPFDWPDVEEQPTSPYEADRQPY